MGINPKMKQRGFVMTGGGAKGLYEAGVIHAFHISGMEFDVITGSSIGAMNSLFFAEYLYHKRRLPEDVRQDPLQALEALDPLVKAFHHAWLQLPDKKVIDDSQQGPLGRLKDDLESLNLDLPLLVRLAWWWTDSDRGLSPPAALLTALPRLVIQLIEHLGGISELLRILKFNRGDLFQEAARTYLRRFGLERSLVPPDQDHKIKDVFTQPVSPLRLEHLQGDVSAPDAPHTQVYTLVDPARTLKEYAGQDIAVRLTRANYRTGRLEMSAYVPVEGFARFMDRHAWRLQVGDPEKIPLGSFRLQVPGNPNALNAALCSGRFPGVFSPYPIESIYPRSDPENGLLYRLLSGWLFTPEVRAAMQQAYAQLHGQVDDHWQKLYAAWSASESMREFFPRSGDLFVDGGAIDNTPSNSAIDYIKDFAERQEISRRQVQLDLFIIFLDVEPKSDTVLAHDPASYQVVQRTLDIQSAASRSNDANTVETINALGKRGEDMAETLAGVLVGLKDSLSALPPEQGHAILDALFARLKELDVRGYTGGQAAGFVDRLTAWTRQVLEQSLPVHVEPVKIYPEQMPLSTLQFTERLGYRQENALQMLTMGCYNTLWTLRCHLEAQANADLDDLDRQVLALVKQWMGLDAWPANPIEQEGLRPSWKCRREACVFHAGHCRHGAPAPAPAAG